jgi:hypothetical protein
MKRYIMQDEWWPMYGLEEELGPDDPGMELTEEEWKDYRRVSAEFVKWQDKLSTAYDEIHKNDKHPYTVFHRC